MHCHPSSVKRVLEEVYGVVLPQPGEHEDPNRPPSAEEFLQAYAFNRGWMTVHGAPNESIAARVILKDYVMGKLCFVHPPLGINPKEWNGLGVYAAPDREEKKISNVPQSVPTAQDRVGRTKRQKKANRKHTEPTIKPSKNVDPYDQQANVTANTKGKNAQSGFTRTVFYHSATPVPTGKVKSVVFAKT